MTHIVNGKKGFTLIELLVVIAIIGLLSSVILAGLNSARELARDTRRVMEVRQIQQALELYYAENGVYPNSHALSRQYDSTRSHTISSLTETDWRAFMEALAPYLGGVAVDPMNEGVYNFRYFSSYYPVGGQWYYFTYRLENPDHAVENIDGAYSWGCGGDGYYRDYPQIVELGMTNCDVAD